MMDAIVDHFDFLTNVMKSKATDYKSIITQASTEELRSIILCARTCLNFKWIRNTKKLRVLQTEVNYDRAKRLFIKNKALIQCVIYAISSRILNQIIQNDIIEEDE